MSNKITSYFASFSAPHWILFLAGVLVFGKIVYEFMFNTLEYSTLNGIGLVLSVISFSAPKYLIDMFKSRTNVKKN